MKMNVCFGKAYILYTNYWILLPLHCFCLFFVFCLAEISLHVRDFVITINLSTTMKSTDVYLCESFWTSFSNYVNHIPDRSN